MAQQQDFFGDTKIALQQYVEERLQLIKLQATKTLSKTASAIIAGILIFIFSFFVLLFISIMGGFYFAELTGSNYIGFGIIAGFYILIVILIIILKKPVLDKILIKGLVSAFFSNNKVAESKDATE